MPAKRKLLVLGIYTKSEGYPNTLFRIGFLKTLNSFEFAEINQPFAPLSASAKKKGLLAACNTVLIAGIAHLSVLLRYLAHTWKYSRPDIGYLPYPAIVTAACISVLPARLRPSRIILDAFISLYDTVVFDRKLLRPQAWLARLLHAIERRAFQIANSVVVDTDENARYLAQLFNLPLSKFTAIPLSTDEDNFIPAHYTVMQQTPCSILFIGTMIPLHGIQVIAKTIQQLSQRDDLRIHLIGDGQDAHLLEGIKPLPANVSWTRQWQNSAELARAIRSADICLGIFGDGEKSQRVCPYKAYAYACTGKAIITGETRWSMAATQAFGADAFALVKPGDSQALTQRIIDLVENPQERNRLAEASRDFYQKFLSNQIAHEKLTRLLDDSGTSEQHQQTQP